MIQSYTQNPSFGDPTLFQDELDSTILKVQKLEAVLHSHNLLLEEVNYKLEQKKLTQKCELLSGEKSAKLSSVSPDGSRSSCAGYGTMSTYSSDSDSEGEQSVVAAMFDYGGEGGDTTIHMTAGEEFVVTDADQGGWTRVRRRNMDIQCGEGFVPTAYLRLADTYSH